MPQGQRQNIDIPLSGGLKQKTAEQWIDPTSSLTAQNAIWTVQNAVEKRPGWTRGITTSNGVTYPAATNSGYSFSWGTTALKGGISLLPVRSGFAICDGWYLYSLTEDSSSNEWQDMVPPCVATRRPIAASPQSVFNPTVANYNGVDLYVWQDTATFTGWSDVLYFALVDEASGRVIRSGPIDPSGATVGASPKIVMSSGTAFVFYQATQTTIKYVSLDMTLAVPVWNAAQAVAGGYVGGGFDVAPTTLTDGTYDFFGLCYAASGAVAVVQCARTIGAYTVSTRNSSNLACPYGNPYAVGCAWDTANSQYWVAFSYKDVNGTNYIQAAQFTVTLAGGAFYFGVNQNYSVALVSYASSTNYTVTRQIGVVAMTANSNTLAGVIWEASGGVPTKTQVGWAAINGTGSVGLNRELSWNTQLLSKPFAVNTPDRAWGSRCYAVVGTVEQQETQILCEFDMSGFAVVPHPVASIATRLATAQQPNGVFVGQMRGAYSLSDVTNFGVLAPGAFRYAGVLSETNNVPSNFSMISGTFDFLSAGRARGVRVGALTYLSGGIPTSFDGLSCVEASTPQQMQKPDLSPLTTGGNMTNGQTYSYVFVPEYRDLAGNVHYGQPSSPASATLGSTGTTGQVTVVAQCISLTTKGCLNRRTLVGQSAMYLVPYRTLYLNGAMTTTYTRLVGDNPGSTYINTPEQGSTITFVDKASDASLASNPLLPTTGGVLEADCPPSFFAICEHNSRVYGIGDDLRTIWVSTAAVDGLPCYFNDGSQFQVESLGDLTAIWSMDSNLFVASSAGIAYVSGSGPNIVGSQSDLSAPTRIPSDVGVTDPRAWCVTPIGTVFRTALGLALLDRSLSVHSDFGDPVAAYLGQVSQASNGGYLFQTVTSIQMHPSRPEILVFVTGTYGIALAGAILVYNYRFSEWSVHLVNDPSTGTTLPEASITSQGHLYQLTSAGRLLREKESTDAAQYQDDANGANTWVPLKISTGWIKPGGDLQSTGWVHQVQPTWIPQDWSDVTIVNTYDYGSVTQSSTFTSTQVLAASPLGVPANVAVHPAPSRCTAMQVTIYDASPAGSPASYTGQGPRILGLSCEVEPAGGLRRLPGSQKA